MSNICCDCCHSKQGDVCSCGCCEGVEILTPATIHNRPGLPKIAYRVGTHTDFYHSMVARLSSQKYPALAPLTTRDPSDPALAFLDGWATVADVLSFYQERIANEGFLRTATERRSILELARLVGYKLKPGVASSVFLAYTIDPNAKESVLIPKGSRSQSVPGPDETPQTFETDEDFLAQAQWNNLQPRLSRPLTSIDINASTKTNTAPPVYLKGTSQNLKVNDLLLVTIGETNPIVLKILSIEENTEFNITKITFNNINIDEPDESYTPSKLISDLIKTPSIQPRNKLRLYRKLSEQFKGDSESGYRVLGSVSQKLKDTLAKATANASVTEDSSVRIYALRVQASLFGHNAPRSAMFKGNTALQPPWDEWVPHTHIDNEVEIEPEESDVIYLDRKYAGIKAESYLVMENNGLNIFKVNDVSNTSRYAYNLSGETTRIKLDKNWWDPPPLVSADNTNNKDNDISAVRTTKVYAQPELLELAEIPIDTNICGGVEDPIELDGYYEGLVAGRWVIISGERDIEGTKGVRFSELAMISEVTQSPKRPPIFKCDNVTGAVSHAELPNQLPEPLEQEKIHTFIILAEPLAFCFKRDTVKLYGNVIKASHGETRNEVLGSGDGSKALQEFDLKQKPLTFTASSNPSGAQSSLEVHVNNIRWHEAGTLIDATPRDRSFITTTDNEDKTTVQFGNGQQGARLPTGVENIKAIYRNGIGKPGNVKAEQITLVQNKPLGVKEVLNPLRSSGGADREGRDQARKNAPLATTALDRLVSVRDYQDFARSFAGIGKALATELTDGRRQLVHVTIAGMDDIPIDETSDLFQNLLKAFKVNGDAQQPVQLAVRELLMLVINANIRLLPDYLWEPVVTQVRSVVLEYFSFENSELGKSIYLSEVISVIQSVPGVEYVDVDTFGGIPEKRIAISPNNEILERRLQTPEEITDSVHAIIKEDLENNRASPYLPVNKAALHQGFLIPAQLAFLDPEVPETLILNQVE